MNNMNSTVTSAFLAALDPDKSQIKTISPLTIFRRLLGVSESPSARDIVAALQQAATRVNRLTEFQKNFVDGSLIGEIISFDIGPASKPAWMKFSVIREPLNNEANGVAINFVVTVTDNDTRYTRMIGAMTRELNKAGEMQMIFRLITDICNVEEIESSVPEKPILVEGMTVNLKKDRDFVHVIDPSSQKEITSFSAPVTPWHQYEEYRVNRDLYASELNTLNGREVMTAIVGIDSVVIDPATTSIVFVKREDDRLIFEDESHKVITDVVDADVESSDPTIWNNKRGYRVTKTIMRRFLLESSISEIMEQFEAIEPEVIFKKGDYFRVRYDVNDGSMLFYKDDGFDFGAPEFTITGGFEGLDEIVKKIQGTTDGSKFIAMDAINEDMATNLTDIMAHAEIVARAEPDVPVERTIAIHEGEEVKFGQDSDKIYISNQDLTQEEVTDIVTKGKIDEFFTEKLPPPPAEIPIEEPPADKPDEAPAEAVDAPDPEPAEETTPAEQPEPTVTEEPKKEHTEMNGDEIIYAKGTITAFFGDPHTYKILEDVTRRMLDEARGDVTAFAAVCDENGNLLNVEAAPVPKQEDTPVDKTALAEEAARAKEAQQAEASQSESSPDDTEPAPVGDAIAERKDIRSAMSRGDFLRMLFSTSNPSIMHLMSLLRKESSGTTFELTGTRPVEQMVAFPTYSFSIVRMKEGRFYRVFVAYTDKENLQESVWLNTHNVPGRWYELCDIQDPDIGRILDKRERRR